MVSTVFYYGTEAITRALVSFVLKLARATRRKREEAPPKPLEIPHVSETWGFHRVSSYGAFAEYRFIPRVTRLEVWIPELVPLRVEHRRVRAEPQRLFFTYLEAASPNWFKSIEALAKELEERGRGEQQ